MINLGVRICLCVLMLLIFISVCVEKGGILDNLLYNFLY